MSKSKGTESSQRNDEGNDQGDVGPIVAEERFSPGTTVTVDGVGNYSSPMLKMATTPGTEFETDTELGFKEWPGTGQDLADPSGRKALINLRADIEGQKREVEFGAHVGVLMEYDPFATASVTDISQEADKDEILRDLDTFKEEVEEELIEDEKERYNATSSALEELRETEGDIDTEDLAAENEVSSDRLEAVLEAAGEYDPSEKFEDIYEVEDRGEIEGDRLVSNIIEFEYLQDNPEEVLAEDLSEDGFSNKAERVLRELDPEEANSIVEEAIAHTDEIKSVYTDCWGNTMAVYQDNSRAKLVDSEVREGSNEEGHALGDMISGAKEEFGDEYLENAIDEVVAGDYDEDVETWFATEYLPENMDNIDDVQTMEKANAVLFDNLHGELENEDEDYHQQDFEVSHNLNDYTEDSLPWSYGPTSNGSGVEDVEEDMSPEEQQGILGSLKSRVSSYLES